MKVTFFKENMNLYSTNHALMETTENNKQSCGSGKFACGGLWDF